MGTLTTLLIWHAQTIKTVPVCNSLIQWEEFVLPAILIASVAFQDQVASPAILLFPWSTRPVSAIVVKATSCLPKLDCASSVAPITQQPTVCLLPTAKPVLFQLIRVFLLSVPVVTRVTTFWTVTATFASLGVANALEVHPVISAKLVMSIRVDLASAILSTIISVTVASASYALYPIVSSALHLLTVPPAKRGISSTISECARCRFVETVWSMAAKNVTMAELSMEMDALLPAWSSATTSAITPLQGNTTVLVI